MAESVRPYKGLGQEVLRSAGGGEGPKQEDLPPKTVYGAIARFFACLNKVPVWWEVEEYTLTDADDMAYAEWFSREGS